VESVFTRSNSSQLWLPYDLSSTDLDPDIDYLALSPRLYLFSSHTKHGPESIILPVTNVKLTLSQNLVLFPISVNFDQSVSLINPLIDFVAILALFSLFLPHTGLTSSNWTKLQSLGP
jgi:hypothetical protein